MEPIALKPEKEQRTYWFVNFWIVFLIIFIPLVVLALVLEYPVNLILGISAAITVIIAIPFLPWIPAYYRQLEYTIDEDAVRGNKGVFWKKRVNVPFTKITNVDITQGPLQRYFKVGTIHIQTAGVSGAQGSPAELKLEGIRDLEGVKDSIMERVRAFTLSKVVEAGDKAVEKSDPEVLGLILKELRAVREALEKKQS